MTTLNYTLTTDIRGKLRNDIVEICDSGVTPVVVDVHGLKRVRRKEGVRTHWNPTLG